MTAPPPFDELVAELDRVRLHGAMNTRSLALEHIHAIAIRCRYTRDDRPPQPDEVEQLLRKAVALLDEGANTSSAAWIFGIARGARVMPLKQRTQKAAEARGIQERAYRGGAEGSHQDDDLRFVAESLLSMWNATQQATEPDSEPGNNHDGRAVLELAATFKHGFSVDSRPPAAVSMFLNEEPATHWHEVRVRKSKELWLNLQDEWNRQVLLLGAPSERLCIFVAGSYGRREATDHSDLDLFLVADAPSGPRTTHGPISRFETAQALSLVDRCRQKLKIQPFSQDGYFLGPHSLRTMLAEIGGQDDASSNRMIARLLLLMNSRPLYNSGLHAEMRASVLDAYWTGASADEPFRPAHLMSDLRRLWLTMVVNFELFYPAPKRPGPSKQARKRRIANLKLQMSQRLGCFTPIFSMLAHSTADGLSRSEADRLLRLTTRERLDDLTESPVAEIAQIGAALRDLYGEYLGFSDCGRSEMELRVSDPGWKDVKQYFSQSHTLSYGLLAAFYEHIPQVAKFALA